MMMAGSENLGRIEMKTSLLIIGMLLAQTPLLSGATESITGSFYLQGQKGKPTPIDLPVTTVTKVRLFDRQISYRNDHKACVAFELPELEGRAITSIDLSLEAYNDDRSYLRAVWFEVDGIGGYLGVSKVSQGQYRGGGTIGAGEQKAWALPLDRLPVSLHGKVTSEVNFQAMLEEPVPHVVCSWISTYREYGPKSWITLDLIIQTNSRSGAAAVLGRSARKISI